jgi:hypothetical protein
MHWNYNYSVLFCCFIYAKGQRSSGFKAIIKWIFKTNLPSLTSAPFFGRFFRPFFIRKILKFTKSCKNASKNEIYLQEIYQSTNCQTEMFAISLSSCSRYNANFKLDQSCSIRYSWQSAIFLRSVRMTTHPTPQHRWSPTPAIIDELETSHVLSFPWL